MAKQMNLGKVIKKHDSGIAETSEGHKVSTECEVGDTLQMDSRTREVTKVEVKKESAAEKLKKEVDELGIDVEGLNTTQAKKAVTLAKALQKENQDVKGKTFAQLEELQANLEKAE